MGRLIPPSEIVMEQDATKNEAVEKARRSRETTRPSMPKPPKPEPVVEGGIEEEPRRGVLTPLPKQQQRSDLERMKSVVEIKPKPATLIEQGTPVRVPEK